MSFYSHFLNKLEHEISCMNPKQPARLPWVTGLTVTVIEFRAEAYEKFVILYNRTCWLGLRIFNCNTHYQSVIYG